MYNQAIVRSSQVVILHEEINKVLHTEKNVGNARHTLASLLINKINGRSCIFSERTLQQIEKDTMSYNIASAELGARIEEL